MTVERTVPGSLAGSGQEHPGTALSNRAGRRRRRGNDEAMPSPVDPSRQTALVRALNQVEMYDLAYEVSTGQVTDLEVVVASLSLCDGDGDGDEELAQAIEAGAYGPYQETE